MQTRVFAPAKINLALHVTGQRADGYHLLDTLVGFASVGDWVGLKPGPATFTVSGPEAAQVPTDARNSVVKLAQHFAPDVPLQIHLEKHLPVASGIGGGSADAAACFRGIAALTGQDDHDAAARLLAIGADVPMCARSVPARVSGIGEQITPLPDLPRLAMVLINPRVEVATPAVFKALQSKDNSDMGALPTVWTAAATLAWLGERRNDLEPPAMQLAPAIGRVLAVLRAENDCALARMSGSGATCFGLFATDALAQAAAAKLRARHPDWWIAPARLDGQDRAQAQLIRETT